MYNTYTYIKRSRLVKMFFHDKSIIYEMDTVFVHFVKY